MKTVFAAALIAATALAGGAALAGDKTKSTTDTSKQAATKTTDAPQTSVSADAVEDRYVDPNSRSRNVPAHLANWLDRTHARPAGR